MEQGVSSSMKVGYGQPGHPQVIDELIIGSGDDLLPLSGTAWMCITHTKCARALHSMGQLNCGHLPNYMVFMDPGLEAISWDAPLQVSVLSLEYRNPRAGLSAVALWVKAAAASCPRGTVAANCQFDVK